MRRLTTLAMVLALGTLAGCGSTSTSDEQHATATPATTSEPVVSACSQLERYERNPDYSEEVCRSRLKIWEGGRHTQETYQEELRACGAARGAQAEREACSGKRTLEAAQGKTTESAPGATQSEPTPTTSTEAHENCEPSKPCPEVEQSMKEKIRAAGGLAKWRKREEQREKEQP